MQVGTLLEALAGGDWSNFSCSSVVPTFLPHANHDTDFLKVLPPHPEAGREEVHCKGHHKQTRMRSHYRLMQVSNSISAET